MEWLINEIEKMGSRILEMQDGSFKSKEDGSPVTKADVFADSKIRELLSAYGIPIVSEESQQSKSYKGDVYFLVDPLDGTKSYVRGEPYFTINIAYVEKRPKWGLIHAPALHVTYYSDGSNSFKCEKGECRKIHVSSNSPLIQASSLNHITEKEFMLSDLIKSKIIRMGSSIKGCLVAEGKADIYPRFGSLMEWDIAAMQSIIESAGGRMTSLDGSEIRYGKPDRRVHGFLASNGKIHDYVLKKVKQVEVQANDE